MRARTSDGIDRRQATATVAPFIIMALAGMAVRTPPATACPFAPEGIRVRAGFLIDQLVPLDAIVAVETGSTGEAVRDPATLNAALLAWPNICCASTVRCIAARC